MSLRIMWTVFIDWNCGSYRSTWNMLKVGSNLVVTEIKNNSPSRDLGFPSNPSTQTKMAKLFLWNGRNFTMLVRVDRDTFFVWICMSYYIKWAKCPYWKPLKFFSKKLQRHSCNCIMTFWIFSCFSHITIVRRITMKILPFVTQA
jgi:hypothetical protein